MAISTELELVASDEEQDGLVHVGVMYDGSFIPLAAVKKGSLEQRKNVPTALAHAEANSEPEDEPATKKK